MEVIFKMMENERAIGEIFNIGRGKPSGIKELAEIIIKISNRKLEPEFTLAQIGDIWESYADITKARKIVGHKPKYRIEQGLNIYMNKIIKSERN